MSSLTGCAKKLQTDRIGLSAKARINKIERDRPRERCGGLKKRRIVSIAEFSIHPIGIGRALANMVKQALQAISKVEGLSTRSLPWRRSSKPKTFIQF